MATTSYSAMRGKNKKKTLCDKCGRRDVSCPLELSDEEENNLKKCAEFVRKNVGKSKILVKCVECPSCKDLIYSRAVHDYHHCSCGEVMVDGGFDYLRYGWKTKAPKIIKRFIPSNRKELFEDWNKRIDKFGRISGKQ